MTENLAAQPLCSYLDWDSKFFGVRIARLEQHRLTPNLLPQAFTWCRHNAIACLYFLSDSDDAPTARLAEQSGFLQTDVRMTFERAIPPAALPPPNAVVRLAREQDLPALRAIAAKSHHDTRFYFDHHFDRKRCDELYEVWIENSFRGFAQAMLVAEIDAQPVGYLTCHLRERESQIGLVAIAPGHQGSGLGKQLVQAFLNWSSEKGATVAKVVTQGRNLPAQRLYQRCGFLTSSFQLWYHRWFEN